LLKLQIVIKIAETLEKLHEHNLAHLDLKPSNILLDDEDLSPTLIDFGISKIRTPTLISPVTQSMRNPTSQYGTIRYCAPEILNGKLSKKVGPIAY
jgi:serine/threonine protein kinase